MTPWSDSRVVSIILAGGRGTRMRSDTKHKVCFEVGGVPIILRALRNYEQCGLDHHIIVIGDLGEQVLHTVGSKYDNVSFAYQSEPLGTGHAAQCGAELLRDTDFDGLVLVVVGDRLVSPHIVHRLLSTQRDARSDLTLVVGAKEDNPTSGRVVFDGGGNAAAIVETTEIALSELVSDLRPLAEDGDGAVPTGQILDRIRDRFADEGKAKTACGDLYTQVCSRDAIGCEELSTLLDPLRQATTLPIWMEYEPEDVPAAAVEERTEYVNLSTYLFRAPVLYEALEHLDADNAQGELYLTDCIRALSAQRHRNGAPRYLINTVAVDHPDDSLSLNTPQELQEIERKLRLSEPSQEDEESVMEADYDAALRPVSEWYEVFDRQGGGAQQFMRDTYGDVSALHERKRRQLLTVLGQAIESFGPRREVFIARSPGRVNLMGRHIDHRGGNTNVIAIDDEIIMVAAPREDDRVTLMNVQDRVFEPREFSISQDIADLDWSDWLTCINSPKTLALVKSGDWSNYVRAAALRLQQKFRNHPLRGADIVCHGTIPIGSGLSSSSAVVVAAAEVLVAVNRLPVRPTILVDLCGEGEWFVGTRGGAGDHAAIKFGKRGSVAHVGFFPFEVREFLPFLEDHSVVVCNSGVEAKKSETARITFNKKVLGYVTGELIFKQLNPQFADSIHHLRDINQENLGIGLAELYEMVKRLPLSLTREDLFSQYGPFDAEDTRKLKGLLSTLPEDNDAFDVRGVVLFGLAEMERAKRCIEYLRAGDAEGFGKLWYISHDGDRVVGHDDDLQAIPWEYEVEDAQMDDLIARAGSEDEARASSAQLPLQPGKYGCSTPELDLIVDVSRRQEGVRGAQVAGAGLGGCCIILAHEGACDGLIDTLEQHGFDAKRYRSVEGAQIINLPEDVG